MDTTPRTDFTIAVRYHSRSGNTKKIAEAVAAALGVATLPVSAPLPEKADILFLGNALYAFDIDDAVKTFLAQNRERIGLLYNVSTTASPASTRKPLARAAQENGIRLAEKEFHCPGSFLMLHRSRPNAADCRAAAAFAQAAVKAAQG